jgi:hypothetical protein
MKAEMTVAALRCRMGANQMGNEVLGEGRCLAVRVTHSSFFDWIFDTNWTF